MEFNEFIDFLKKRTKIDWNFSNISYMKIIFEKFIEMNVNFDRKNDKTINTKIIQPLLRNIRHKNIGTILCVDYWKSIGYTDLIEINKKISLIVNNSI